MWDEVDILKKKTKQGKKGLRKHHLLLLMKILQANEVIIPWNLVVSDSENTKSGLSIKFL